MPSFKIIADFRMTGDQPQAVDKLVEGLGKGHRFQTLLGVTGSGKTFSMANIVERVQRPTLVIAHNKTLAAQLATEFKEFFPENAVEYFVSYYDYYQPEAYIPRSDTYIEKDADINEEIDKLRHAATRALLTRRDVLIVASVSCIYGLGSPEEYQAFRVILKKGETVRRDKVLRQLIDMQYERNDIDFTRGKFRVRGDTLEIQPAYEDLALRIQFWGDEVEKIQELDPLTGEIMIERDSIEVYPAKHFVTSEEKMFMAIEDIEKELEERLAALKEQGKVLEAARLEQRTKYDIEILRETGYCSGIENYSRHLARREAGSRPSTLLDYFPDDFLLFIDESHMTVPQIHGMYHGDKARKTVLVDFGFRLPSAMDNRPWSFDEFEAYIGQTIFVSATPSHHEFCESTHVIEDRGVENAPRSADDTKGELRKTRRLLDDVKSDAKKGKRSLVAVQTKPFAQHVVSYLMKGEDNKRSEIKAEYVEAGPDTAVPNDVLQGLVYGNHVVVGVNLPRDQLDRVEVDRVAVLEDRVVEQVIRPTGLLDPTVEVKPTDKQIDDLLHQIKLRVERQERVLVTTLTKRMAEELADYLREMGVKVHYLHSEQDTLERSEVLRDLRLGVYDVVVGINLLREGLDLPEVSLVAILDADKEGYLRSSSSLVQTIGRASRHENGHVIMYADNMTASMRFAIDETYRRRKIQAEHNEKNGIVPQGIKKAIKDITERMRAIAEERAPYLASQEMPRDEIMRLIKDLESQMKQASRDLEFEKAATLRDRIIDLRKALVLDEESRIPKAGERVGAARSATATPSGERPSSGWRPSRRGGRGRR